MEKLANAVAVPLGILASISTVIMMLGISFEVVYRNLVGRSFPGVLELSESALVATVFLGLAYAGTSGSHIAVDLLVSRLPEPLARAVMTLAWLLSAGILAWLTYATFDRAVDSTQRDEVRMGLVNWPLWPARWLIVVGLAAFLLVALINIWRLVKGKTLMGEGGEQIGAEVQHTHHQKVD